MIKELFDEKIQQPVGRYDQFEMIPYLVNKEGYELAIYGNGENGRLINDLLKRIYNIAVSYFIDKRPQNSVGGCRVVSTEQVLNTKYDKLIVVISPLNFKFNMDVKCDILMFLKFLEVKCNKLLYFYGGNITDGFKLDWYHFIKQNAENFEKTFNMLESKKSKEQYIDFLKIYINGQKFSGLTYPEVYKYWGIDDNKNIFFRMLENEVILSLGGSYAGDTVYQFLKLNRDFKKYIVVEGDKKNYEQMIKNLSYIGNSMRKKIQADCYYIGEDNYRIDDLYIDDDITLINMDIEGYELSALKSAENIIKKNRPVLALCTYHKKCDLIELPNYINSIVDDYKFVIRKYPSEFYCMLNADYFYVDFAQANNELVLYGIPNERYVKCLSES